MSAQRANLFRRRWKLTAVLGLLALLAGVVAAMAQPPKYSATAQMVTVAPSSQVGVTGPTNPFLNFTGSLNVTAGVLALAVTDDKTVKLVQSQGGQGTYTVTTDAGASEPIIDVVATARTSSGALTTVKLVLAQLTSQLVQRQQAAGAPAKSFISLLPLGEPANASRVLKSAIEVGVAVFGILALLSLFLILGFDRWRLRGRSALAANVTRLDADAEAAEGTTAALQGTARADTGDGRPQPSRRKPFEIPMPQFRSRFKKKSTATPEADAGTLATPATSDADALAPSQAAEASAARETTEPASEAVESEVVAELSGVAAAPTVAVAEAVDIAAVPSSRSEHPVADEANADEQRSDDDFEDSDAAVIQAIIRDAMRDETDDEAETEYPPQDSGVAAAAADAVSVTTAAVHRDATADESHESTGTAGDAADHPPSALNGRDPAAIVMTGNGMRLVRGRTKRMRYRVNGEPLLPHVDQ